MKGQIIKKKYYRITFQAKSPLAVGSGENESSDRDLIRDSFGIPYLPASAIAGVTRDLLRDFVENLPDYYGEVIKAGESDADEGSDKGRERGNAPRAAESRLIFYDGTIAARNVRDIHVSVRDSVCLDDYKTAKTGAKFDMEVLEPGITFLAYIEQNFIEEDDPDLGAIISDLFLKGRVVFGAKGTRGYGGIENASVSFREFSFEGTETGGDGLDEWLSFDMYDDEEWHEGVARPYTARDEEACAEGNKGRALHKLTLSLKQDGGISIRRYTTEAGDNESIDPQPDFEQLTVNISRKDPVPTIPGTSWAGAIRHRMRELGMGQKEEKFLFGFVEQKSDRKARSKIRFSETMLTGASPKILSRNSIDRFTGGTKEGALFTEKTWYGGTTDLVISYEEGCMSRKDGRQTLGHILAAAITDLHCGLLAIGGETSIGRGLFRIEKINNKDVGDSTDIYKELVMTIEGEGVVS